MPASLTALDNLSENMDAFRRSAADRGVSVSEIIDCWASAAVVNWSEAEILAARKELGV